MADTSSRSNDEQGFAAAVAAVRGDPGRAELWDEVESLGEALQRGDEVAALHREALGKSLSPETASELGQRAVAFLEEWAPGDESQLAGVLRQVLALDPDAEWAFVRLTAALTLTERWTDLLAVYDQLLAAKIGESRRLALLEEAADIARDFAGEPDRAVDYMQQMLALRPDDARLEAALERLVEKQGRWRDLVALWTRRIEQRRGDAAEGLQLKIAQTWLDRLHAADQSLAAVQTLMRERPGDPEGAALLERLLVLEGATPAVRVGALDLLRATYDASLRPDEVIRVLLAALAFADRETAIGLHRELAERLVPAGRALEAMHHAMSVLELLPSSEVDHRRLRHLAEESGQYALYVRGLLAAVGAESDPGRRAALLAEAGEVQRVALKDVPAAIELYQRALAEQAVPKDLALRTARTLSELLDAAGRVAERQAVLERLGALEHGPAQALALGEAAKLAAGLGDPERALQSWRGRLALDPSDPEALSASIELLAELERWDELVDVLRQRAHGPVAEHQRRADQRRVAQIQAEHLDDLAGAVTTWQEISRTFGESDETVEALAGLLARVTRWPDLAELLERASGRETARVAELSTRLGDVFRGPLAQPARAVACYDAALTADPGHADARAGLLAVIDTPEGRPGAVAALGKLYRARGEWRELAAIAEQRLAVVSDPVRRADILRETASLQEEHAGDPAGALRSLARAFPLQPYERELERELVRLSEETGDWTPAVEAYRAAAEAVGDDARRVGELRLAEGKAAEQHLRDAAGALAAYQATLRTNPLELDAVRGAIRSAAGLGRWDAVAQALVGQIVAAQRLDPQLVELAHAQADAHSGWEELTPAFEAAVFAAESSLPPELFALLAAKIGAWHRDYRGVLDAARAALQRSVAAQPGQLERLLQLAELQRATPDEALIETLLALDRLREDNLDELYEASELALGLLGDTPHTREILQRLYDRASGLWSRGAAASGARSHEESAAWSSQKLAQLFEQSGDRRQAAELLRRAGSLPFAAETARTLRLRAAASFGELGERKQAIALYESAVAAAPDDLETVRTLASLLEGEQRFPEVLGLRHHELSRTQDPARKLELRLDIARLVGVIEQRGGRVEALRANLEEDPSHDPSLAALIAVLGSKASPDELATFLGEHAERLEKVGDKARAVRLWTQLAELGELRLGDVERALSSHRRVVLLDPNPYSLDALARLHMARGEPGEAVPWLTQRLERTPAGPERTEVVLKLADALLGSNATARAIHVLTRAVAEDPREPRTRDLLLRLLREAQAWQPLALLLQTAAENVSDSAQMLEYLYEATGIYRDRLGAREQAIPVLARLHAMVPDDRGVQGALADALIMGSRWDEARAILEKVLADFGRRRPPERVRVHQKLADIARAQGDMKTALAQLEQATAIDMSDVASLQMLAELSRDTGDFARAERSYRALLLAARRRGVEGDERLIGIAEAQYELSRLAQARGQQDTAQELLDSAIETALQDEREARKLQRALRARGDAQLLVRVLRSRLGAAQEPAQRAPLLAELADALEATGGAEEALGLRLQALQDEPTAAELHKSAAEAAERLGQGARYVDAVLGMVDRARRKPEAGLQAELLLRAGEVVERALGDHARAEELYARAEATGQRVVEAWAGQARVAAARGDAARQIALLERITGAPDDAMTPETRARATLGLAEIQLASPDTRDAGVTAVRRALATELRNEDVEPILRRALEGALEHEGLVALYDEVVRALGDRALLLASLEKRAQHPGASPRLAHEAAELALELGEAERAEALMSRTLELAREQPGNDEQAIWALLALAERHKRAGDLAGSVAFLRDAAGLTEPGRTFALGLELAGLAAEHEDKLSLSAELYEDLLQQDPTNRAVWAPLLDVYKRSGDAMRMQHLVESTLTVLGEPRERNALRLDLVHALLEGTDLEHEAVRVLKDVLMEEPGHKEAEKLLAEVFERTGFDAELVELLQQQILAAQEAKDEAAVVAATLRLGGLHSRTQPDEALAVYRAALDFAPSSQPIIAAMLALLTGEDDARERVELSERLLANESGEGAVRLALELVGQYEKLGDRSAVARVLERAHKGAPDSQELHDRLERHYRALGEYERLAELLVGAAQRQPDPPTAVRLLREASEIYADQLMDAAKAAEVLHAAVGLDPLDNDVLREYIARLGDTGEHVAAVEELTRAIDWRPLDKETMVEFLRKRAELQLIVGEEALAASDLEEAYELVGAELIPDLVDGLERWRGAASKRGDRAGERSATLRLAEILRKEGAEEQARHALAGWVQREPGDAQALRTLIGMDSAAGRWESVVETLPRLVAAETGEEQIKAALQLVEACERVGRPHDARVGLEAALKAQPGDASVRAKLKQIYEETENYVALARLLIGEASSIPDPGARFLTLRQAGELLLDEDPPAAAEALRQALALRPTDQAVNLLLVDAYMAAKQYAEADAILDGALEQMKGRRSPELCVVQHRKAALAAQLGDTEHQLHWLKEAHNTDRNNGEVALELANLTESLGDYDNAIRVLRSIALMENAPLSRAIAYLRQGYIAEKRSDRQKAVLWGRKALMEDPGCVEAQEFLRQIGEL